MKKYFILLLLLVSYCRLSAQTADYGVVDTADLKLIKCDFEQSAAAMVLFDKAEVVYKFGAIQMIRHKRIKILNDKGADEANVRIQYYGAHKDEMVTLTDAQTINLIGNEIVKTPIDRQTIFEEKVDKEEIAKVFTFPMVKAGSIIEYKYKFETAYGYNYPDWQFQTAIPTRYSEFKANFNVDYPLNFFHQLSKPMAIDSGGKIGRLKTRYIWAMANIPAFKVEPYMNSQEENLQRVYFRPTRRTLTWAKVGENLLLDEDYGLQLDRSLDKEEEIVKKAHTFTRDEEKVAYIFNLVKNTLTWNKKNLWYTEDGTKRAWNKRTGNSAEINLILYHLLRVSGLDPKLLTFSTRNNGKLQADYPEYYRLNKTAVEITIGDGSVLVLDASDKFNTYDKVPLSMLGLNMLTVDRENRTFGFKKLYNSVASRQVVFVNAEVKANGSMEGATQISSTNYEKASALKEYSKGGQKDYLKKFSRDNNDIIIASYKISDMETDSLPLREDISFKQELTGSDGTYIYFSPNLFSGLGVNPFLNEGRVADIDFVYPGNFAINGNYKIPAGYKVDAIPKSLLFVMPDKSITFKRTIGEVEGSIVVHYVIDIKRTYYEHDEYPELRQFFKKMYEMLNEQIVLKKI